MRMDTAWGVSAQRTAVHFSGFGRSCWVSGHFAGMAEHVHNHHDVRGDSGEKVVSLKSYQHLRNLGLTRPAAIFRVKWRGQVTACAATLNGVVVHDRSSRRMGRLFHILR